MSELQYTEYLHDEWEEIEEFISDQLNYSLSEEERDKLGRPFYEVSVKTTIDTETGVVYATHFQGHTIVPPVKLN